MSHKTFSTIQPMNQKYRQKPKEIFDKLNSDISQIQAQVKQYNLRQQKLSELIPKSFCSKNSTLKMLTQPKLQKILLEKDFNQDQRFSHFKQTQYDQKGRAKLSRKNTLNNNFFDQKTVFGIQSNIQKDKRSITLNDNGQKIRKQNNFTYIQKEQQNQSIKQLKMRINHSAKSKISNNKKINEKSQSFFTRQTDSNLLFQSALLKDRNRASTFNDSIIMPFAEQINLNQQESCQLESSRNLQLKIAAKQKQLQKQWNKTQKYQQKLGIQNSNERNIVKNDNRFRKNSKIENIIQKIKIRRPYTTMTNRNNIPVVQKDLKDQLFQVQIN